MGRARRLGVMFACSIALVLVAVPAGPPVVGAPSDDAPPSTSSDDARFLSDPLVVGTDAVGEGALRIQDGVVSSEKSNFDDAPPEMSLKTFAFIDHGGSGYSAVFHFFHPIVQLHEWRRFAVRH